MHGRRKCKSASSHFEGELKKLKWLVNCNRAGLEGGRGRKVRLFHHVRDEIKTFILENERS